MRISCSALTFASPLILSLLIQQETVFGYFNTPINLSYARWGGDEHHVWTSLGKNSQTPSVFFFVFFLPTQTRVADNAEPKAYLGVYLFDILTLLPRGNTKATVKCGRLYICSLFKHLNEPHVTIIVTFLQILTK